MIKILRGLQGTAATTIIARGFYDAYKHWKGSNNSAGDNNSNDDKTKINDKVNSSSTNSKSNGK